MLTTTVSHSLVNFLIALLRIKTVNLAELATALDGRVKPESSYKKRLHRFLRGFVLGCAEELARLVVELMSLKEVPLYLTLDRTNWRFGKHELNILILGISHQGGIIPLLWTLLPEASNSNTDTAERIALMKRFLAMFDRERIATLLAAYQFNGYDGFCYMPHHHISIPIRLKRNTCISNSWNKLLCVSVLFNALQLDARQVLFGRCPVRCEGVSCT